MIERRRPKARRRSFGRTRTGQWHRVIGVIGGLFFVFLALTGVVIHHADDLALGDIVIRTPWLLGIWGVTPTIVGVETESGWVATDGKAVYPPVGPSLETEGFVAAITVEGVLVVASDEGLWLLTETGDLLDRWGDDILPGPIQRLAISDHHLLVETDRGVYRADSSFMELAPYEPATSIQWTESTSPLPEEIQRAMRSRGAGPGLSLERMLLDLHSGRAFGPIGPYLVDLAALALSFVVLTGLVGWWRRWGTAQPERTSSPGARPQGETNGSEGRLSLREETRNSDRRSA